MQQQLLTESEDDSYVPPQNVALGDVTLRNVALRDVPPHNVVIGDMAPHIVAHQQWKDPARFPKSNAGKGILGCSIIQLVSAVLSVIFEAASFGQARVANRSSYEYFSISMVFPGPGAWPGILAIIAASFGIAAGRRKRNKCLIIAHMVLSIISSVFVIGLLVSTGFSIQAVRFCDYNSGCAGWYHFQGLQVVVLLCGLVIAVSSIVSSAFCCHAVCCCSKSTANRNDQYAVANQSQPGGAPGYGPNVVAIGQPLTGASMYGQAAHPPQGVAAPYSPTYPAQPYPAQQGIHPL